MKIKVSIRRFFHEIQKSAVAATTVHIFLLHFHDVRCRQNRRISSANAEIQGLSEAKVEKLKVSNLIDIDPSLSYCSSALLTIVPL